VSRADIANLAAIVVGAVFVYAGVAKALAGREWPRAAARLGVPRAMAYTVMLAEIIVGLGMVLGDAWRDYFLAAGAVLLVAFTLLLAKHLRSGNRPPCACFGGASQRPIGASDVVRNVSLLVLVFVAILP
jgi:uncharacterized membrane protein YphA (DoxX/SURF4 family)